MKLTKSIIEKTRRYTKKLADKIELTHDWSHVCFVVNHAKYIAKNEGMNINIVEMGALLHDINYPKKLKEFVYGDHATPSAKKAKKFLKSLKLDKEIIEHILDTIKYHSGKNIVNAKTREALAVYDADKLDGIGPRGLIRIICWNVKYKYPNATIDELYNLAINTAKKRLKRVKTKTGKILAKKYYNQTKEFIKNYEKINQKCKSL